MSHPLLEMVDSVSQTKKRIVVAMSGGVDSSTVAAVLKHFGHDVIGVTLQLYDYGLTAGKKGACCAGQDIYDASEVAKKLDIPHYVLDYESIFKEAVIDDFADSYLRGETPIPCVRCNQRVKFKDLFKVAKDLGADCLATGHYVRRIEDEAGKSQLLSGFEKSKDQSYFLFTTTQAQLDYLRFPIGSLTKPQTRELANYFGLKTADKPDSQDICFVPNGSYSAVIEKYRPGALDSGNIVDTQGKILGTHNGIINFTIGQRRGIGISSAEPLYVVKINPDANEVVVGSEDMLFDSELEIVDVNWLLNSDEISETISCDVKLRSAHTPIKAIVTPNGDRAIVKLNSAYKGITPGQACVMYDNDRVLGGGWIARKSN